NLEQQENKILLALSDLQNKRIKSIQTAAKLYNIFYTILYIYTSGIFLYIDIHWYSHKLTQSEKNLAVSRLSIIQEITNILEIYKSISLLIVALHNTALLAQKNVNLYTANKKVVKKYTRSTKQILCKEDLTVEESLQLIAQLDLPAEAPAIDFYTQSKLSIQPDQLATRAPPSISSHKLANQENKILLVLSDLKENRIQSLCAAAKLYKIPESILYICISGTQFCIDQSEIAPIVVHNYIITAIESICADSYLLLLYIVFQGKVYISSWFDNLLKNWRLEVSVNSWIIDKIDLQ
ncbi:DNA binding HTH domain Psq-type, partial [Penicillium hetheringtonii]